MEAKSVLRMYVDGPEATRPLHRHGAVLPS